jgi:PAS domain S-box-containing protein
MRHLPACACLKDEQGRYVFANEGFARLLGRKPEDMLGRTDEEVFGPLSATLKRGDAEALAGRETVRGEGSLPAGGSDRRFETLKFPVPRESATPLLGAIYTDVTEKWRAERDQRELEMRVRQMQKLETLGALGGGIAHDFNNMLAGILGYADLALADLPPGSPAQPSIAEVVAASKRAAEICRQLLAYCGQMACSVEPVDLSDLVRQMSGLTRVTIAQNAEVALSLPDDLPAVEADAVQLRQVIVNLLMNASEALEGKKGRIEIATGRKWCGLADLRNTYLGETIREGEYVFLKVADTGVGMDEATRARMFDPFFSTKFAGRGLGLAAVIGIVRAHQGAIEVESQLGKGTTVTILVPASERKAIRNDVRRGDASEWVGQGTVLVVDNESFVRAVASTMLERMGFSVAMAEDGPAAVEKVRSCPDIVAVLLNVPLQMSEGVAAYDLIQKSATRPLPVVFSSGFSKPAIVNELERHHAVRFIHKPYELEELRGALRQVLG